MIAAPIRILRPKCYSSIIATIMMVCLSGCTNPEQQLRNQLQEAYQLLENKNPDAAIKVLEEIKHTYPHRPEVFEALAYAHAARKDLEAGFYFERAVQLDPQRSELLLFAAESYKQNANPEAAIRVYKTYLDLNPEDPFAWEALGQVYSSQGQLKPAINAYLKTAQLSGPTPPASLAVKIGNLFIQLNNTPQAENWFQIALEQEPSSPQVLLGLLKVALLQEKWSAAEKITQRLQNEYPGLLEVSDMASVPQQLERWRSARQELERELRAQERALQELERNTASTQPRSQPTTSPSSLSDQARRAMAAGDYPKAIDLYWQIINAGKGSAQTWRQLSMAYIKVGDKTKAAITARAAKDFSTNNTNPAP